jgi:putative transposase
VVDDNTMLPLGRPTITTALDEYTRCPTGFYAGFEPPSCLAVLRCLKHAILPKTYLAREYPSVKNHWDCYGVPETIVVDNPPEFHSIHFERACLQIGADIQYAKVRVPWYKGKLERFQGTMNHDLLHGKPGTTFSNVLERDEYDPTKQAVILLSTFRVMLHKWIIDSYLQTPHRGIRDIPAQRWQADTSALPPPLPPSANSLDIVLGMTAQRVAFHYGIELAGLKYNCLELGELRRQLGSTVKLDLTFDPADLGHINVLNPLNGTYVYVPALDQAYAKGLSLWQNKVVRRYAQQQLNDRTDIVALAQAKAEIRALVERDFNRKTTSGRKRQARFLAPHGTNEHSETPQNSLPPIVSGAGGNTKTSSSRGAQEPLTSDCNPVDKPSVLRTTGVQDSIAPTSEFFRDEDVLPVFEANLDLPLGASITVALDNASVTEDASECSDRQRRARIGEVSTI